MQAMFAAVNPAIMKGESLRNNSLKALQETLRPPHPNITLQRAVYKGISQMFDGLRDADSTEQAVSGGEVVNGLKAHLCRPDAGSEAVRLMRADAIASVARYSSSLVAEMREEVLALMKEEPSASVRDRLSNAIGA